MSDVFMILLCIVLLTLILAIAVRLGDQGQIQSQLEGFDIPPQAVTAQIAYEESEEDGTGPLLTGSYEQKTNNSMRGSARRSQIMETVVNPQLET